MINKSCPSQLNNVESKFHTKATLATIIFLCGWVGLHAQDATIATGGSVSGSGGSVSYSVGQIFYSSHSTANGSVAQGVQHYYQIAAILGFDLTHISLDLSVYPNPTSDVLNLRIDNYDMEKLSYQLYNMQGVLVLDKNIAAGNHLIKMSGLPESTYFLNVAIDQTTVKTFKIIKN